MVKSCPRWGLGNLTLLQFPYTSTAKRKNLTCGTKSNEFRFLPYSAISVHVFETLGKAIAGAAQTVKLAAVTGRVSRVVGDVLFLRDSTRITTEQYMRILQNILELLQLYSRITLVASLNIN
jgi:hypothetical protein